VPELHKRVTQNSALITCGCPVHVARVLEELCRAPEDFLAKALLELRRQSHDLRITPYASVTLRTAAHFVSLERRQTHLVKVGIAFLQRPPLWSNVPFEHARTPRCHNQ
jgi:hypothetical protein